MVKELQKNNNNNKQKYIKKLIKINWCTKWIIDTCGTDRENGSVTTKQWTKCKAVMSVCKCIHCMNGT